MIEYVSEHPPNLVKFVWNDDCDAHHDAAETIYAVHGDHAAQMKNAKYHSMVNRFTRRVFNKLMKQ
jgi:hypothetical protein